MSKLKIKLLDSNQKIEKSILAASEKEIKNIFRNAKPKVESAIKQLIVEALTICPEIASLKSGQLKYDFGLVVDPSEDIIYAVANSAHVIFKDFRFNKKEVKNIFSVYIQSSDFNNLLSLAVANVITERGEVLPWMEWLLTAGDAIVILDYSVEYGLNTSSRTGNAIMVPGGFFRVDPKYSGTTEDNFITRALEKYSSRIEEIIRRNI